MFQFLLIVQTLVAASLVGVILMQRSEGGGLGVGGSSSGFMTARGAADFLTRATAILGGLFMANVLRLIRRSPIRSVRLRRHNRSLSRQRRLRIRMLRQYRSPNNASVITFFFATRVARLPRSPLSPDSHGAVHICHRRRGLIAW